ncbi:hypothetical protein DAD99_06875 [Pseudarthrobacter sp. AB1]|nr:hypothetical protein [Pseudarthrobacter sp. AB1]
MDLEMSSELLHSLCNGDLDLALVHLPAACPDMAVRELGCYKFVAFRDAVTEPFDVSELRLPDLAGRTILTLPSNLQPHPCWRRATGSWKPVLQPSTKWTSATAAGQRARGTS